MSREKRSAQVYQWGETVKGGWNFMNRAKEVRLLALKHATGLCIDGRRGGGGGAGTSHVTLWTWSNFASDAGACSSTHSVNQRGVLGQCLSPKANHFFIRQHPAG